MEEETVDVPRSDTTMEETPIETLSEIVETTETPAEIVEETVPTTEPELFELPDGRKVDAGTVAQEYKNLLTDYTKKSQTLAEIEKSKLTTTTDKPYTDPEWAPQTYAELIEIAKQEVKGELESEQRHREEQQQSVENQVIGELNEIKTSDPTLNENALFLHATKYGFKDLKLAHQNMKDMASVVKKTQQITAENITKRQDPVSVAPGASGLALNPADFATAVEYMRALKGNG